jgi:hypothetical protein
MPAKFVVKKVGPTGKFRFSLLGDNGEGNRHQRHLQQQGVLRERDQGRQESCERR